ncbi:MAG: response regulator [Acidobacteriota bacterium]
MEPRALVVDDDEPIRTLLATIVQSAGFNVETAKDGREAMDRIDADRYDVILLDLMMPRVDGYQVLDHLRDVHPDLVPCTIVATAIPERDLRRQSITGVFKVHSKPFDISRLISDIRQCAAA